MPLPSSGTISLSHFQTEMVDTGSIDFTWIANNTKTGQVPSPNSITGYYSKRWYAQTYSNGNCANGNCTTGTQSGYGTTGDLVSTYNCFNTTNNCTTTDSQNWLQNDCNCATWTYNCTQNKLRYNCNCDCADCVCDCTACACACDCC